MDMLGFLGKIFNSMPIRVRIGREWISVANPNTGKTAESVPEIAIKNISGKKIIYAVGRNASLARLESSGDIIVTNPFNHPRIVISDFVLAEKVLTYFLREVMGNGIFVISPIVVMHVTDQLEGGLSDIERRALTELAMGAGAREASVLYGDEVSALDLNPHV